MNAFFERRIMPVGRKPLFGRVVLHVGQLVLDVDPDGQFAQGLGFSGGRMKTIRWRWLAIAFLASPGVCSVRKF